MSKVIQELEDKDVNVKLSFCQKCDGVVCASVEHAMTIKDKNVFMKNVMEHNLSVKTIPLLEYRKNKPKWCSC